MTFLFVDQYRLGRPDKHIVKFTRHVDEARDIAIVAARDENGGGDKRFVFSTLPEGESTRAFPRRHKTRASAKKNLALKINPPRMSLSGLLEM